MKRNFSAANLISRSKWSLLPNEICQYTRISLTLYWLMKYQQSQPSTQPIDSFPDSEFYNRKHIEHEEHIFPQEERDRGETKSKYIVHSRVHSHFNRTARKDSAASRMHVRKLGAHCMHAWWIVCADCCCRKWQDTKLWPLPSSEFHSSIPCFLHSSLRSLAASFSVTFVLYTSLSSSSIATAAYCCIREIAWIAYGFFRFYFCLSQCFTYNKTRHVSLFPTYYYFNFNKVEKDYYDLFFIT